MRRAWIVIAGILALAAVAITLKGAYDYAFIVATLGAVSWFLSYRAQMKELNVRNEFDEESVDDTETNDD
jgi:hypothetical protein